MARLLLISAEIAAKDNKFEEDDISGFFEDNHEFSPSELSKFKVLDIPGLERFDVIGTKKMQEKLVSGLISDLFTPPSDYFVYPNGSDWCEIKNFPGKRYTFKNITEAEREELKIAPKLRQLEILDKVMHKLPLMAENQTVLRGFDGKGDYE